MAASLYDLAVRSVDGQMRSMGDFRGKVLLIVNVASECGYTPQYQGLEALHRQYHDRGLVVLGFPCDQFGHQEPGTEAEIVTFCETRFGVTFPLFAKIDVNGASADPLYRHLKTAKPGLLGTERIKWNFTKFLVDRHGTVIERFGSADTPEKIEPKIRALVDR